MSASPPSVPPTALHAAARSLAAGQPQDAVARLDALVGAAPTYAAAFVLLAKAREAAGDRAGALDAWHQAHALVPNSPLIRRERQRLLAPAPQPPAPAPQAPPAPPPAPEPQAPAGPIAPDLLAPDAPPAAPLPEPEDDDRDWSVVEETAQPLTAPDAAPLHATPVAPDAPDLEPEPAAPGDVIDAVEVDDSTPAQTGGFAVADGLDALIRDLEQAPRITPDPDFRGPEVTFGEADVDDMASETLAQIYAAQHQYAEAAVIYEKLARARPDEAETLLARAAEMRERSR